jgi:hypothetical protein
MNIKLTNDNLKLFHNLRLQLRTAYIHAVAAVKGPNAHEAADLDFTDKIEARLEALFIEAKKVLPEGERPIPGLPPSTPALPPMSGVRVPPLTPRTVIDDVENGIKDAVARAS